MKISSYRSKFKHYSGVCDRRPCPLSVLIFLLVLSSYCMHNVIAVTPSILIELYSYSSSTDGTGSEVTCSNSSNYLECLTPIRTDGANNNSNDDSTTTIAGTSTDTGTKNNYKNTIPASHAVFGTSLHFGKPTLDDYDNRPRKLVQPPSDDPLLCQLRSPLTTIPSDRTTKSFPFENYFLHTVILIPRGGCEFESKALNAQILGADGIIVYNTLESRYDHLGLVDYIDGFYVGGDDDNNYNHGGRHRNMQTTTTSTKDKEDTQLQDIIWPTIHIDYECENGQAWIPKEVLSFTPLPYNATINNPLLTGSNEDGNLCAQGDMSAPAASASSISDLNRRNSFETKCASQRCLLTGDTKIVKELKEYEYMMACCAWDTYIILGGDARTKKDDVIIPSVFVTMEQGDWLSNLLLQKQNHYNNQTHDSYNDDVYIVMYERYHPIWNGAYFILWVLAVFATWVSTYMSAYDLRRTKYLLENSDIRLVNYGSEGNISNFNETSNSNRNNSNNRNNNNDNNPADDGSRVGNASDVGGHDNNIVSGGEQELTATSSDNEHSATGMDSNNSEGQNLQECENQNSSTTTNARTSEANLTTNTNQDQSQQQQQQQQQQHGTNNSIQDLQISTSSAFNVPPFDGYDEDHDGSPMHLSIGGDSRVLNATAFLIISSIVLFILLFARVYVFMRVIYSITLVFAGVKVILYPSMQMLTSFVGVRKQFESPICARLQCCGFDHLSWLDFFCVSCGTLLGVTWIGFGLVATYAGTHAFFWVTKDILGICFSMLLLDFVRLKGIRIITFFLVIFFFFDFIFILFSAVQKAFQIDDEILLSNSTRQPLTTLGDFCEKYSDDQICIQYSSSLPMNLSIPLINDYRGTYAALGVTDVIIPGLLISVCARLDASKRLLRTLAFRRRAARRGITNFRQHFQDHYHKKSFRKRLFSGYFIWVMISYAVALVCLYVVQCLTNRSQPAMFYISPLTLLTVTLCAVKRRDWYRLWNDHASISIAARVVEDVAYVGPEVIGAVTFDDDDETISVGSSNSSLCEEREVEMPGSEGIHIRVV